MLYQILGYKMRLDQNGALVGYIVFLAREGVSEDAEYGNICDIIKLSPAQFNPQQFNFGADVAVTYDRLGNVRSITAV